MPRFLKIIFILAMLFVVLLFSVNILLTHLANGVIRNREFEGIDKKHDKVTVNATISVFPWIKVGAFDLTYFHNNKLAMSVGNVYTRLSFFDLLKKKITLKKIMLDDVVINLSNFHQPTENQSDTNKSCKPNTEGLSSNKGEQFQLHDLKSFMTIDELELSNIKIIKSQHNFFELNSLHFVKRGEDIDFSIKARLLVNDQIINITSIVDTEKKNAAHLKITQENNEILISIQQKQHQIIGQIKGNLLNRELLNKLQIASADYLPNTFLFKFDIIGQKLNVSSFNITYHDNLISGSAIIDGLATQVLTLNITLPKQWLEALNDSKSNTCFIPDYVSLVMQGVNTKINLTTMPQNESKEDINKYTLDIDLNGIHYPSSLPSTLIPHQLDICFPARDIKNKEGNFLFKDFINF